MPKPPLSGFKCTFMGANISSSSQSSQSSPLIKIQFNDSNAKVIAEHTVPGGGGTRREFPSNLLKQG